MADDDMTRLVARIHRETAREFPDREDLELAQARIAELERENAALKARLAHADERWSLAAPLLNYGGRAQRLRDAEERHAREQARLAALRAWQEQAREIVQAVADDLDAGMTEEDINDAAQRLYALLASERGEEPTE